MLREPLSRGRQVALGTVGVLGCAAILEGCLRAGLIAGEGLPMPTAVLSQVWSLLGDRGFWEQIGFTTRVWFLGMLLAAVVGVVLGGLMGAVNLVYELFVIPVEVLRPLPSIAIGPLLVLLIGVGVLPLAVTVAVACVWPILFNAMYAARAVDPVALETARTLHIAKLKVLTRVRLPAAFPFMFTGVRVSASIGLIVAVSAELLFGDGRGLGGYILLASTTASNLDAVYAATLIAGVLGLAFSGVLSAMDRAVFGWKEGLAQ